MCLSVSKVNITVYLTTTTCISSLKILKVEQARRKNCSSYPCHLVPQLNGLTSKYFIAAFLSTFFQSQNKISSPPFFFLGRVARPAGSQFPDQGLNLGHRSESLES